MRKTGSVLFFCAWALWLSAEYWAFGEYSYQRQHDAAEANTAYYTALPLLAERGLIGFWHPLAGTGVDALANLKGDIIGVEAVFRIVRHWSAGAVLLFLQTLIAGLGTALLLRRHGGVQLPIAVLAGAYYAMLPVLNIAYSGFSPWNGWFLPGLPFAILALDWCARVRAGVAAAVGIGALLALGAPTASGLLVLPVIAWWLLVMVPAPSRRRTVQLMLCCAAGYVIVKAPVLVALATSVQESHRTLRAGVVPATGWGLRTGEADEVLRTSAVPIAIALWAGVMGRRSVNPLLAAIAAILVLILIEPQMNRVITASVGAMGSYQWSRLGLFVPFLATAAAALALTGWKSLRLQYAVIAGLAVMIIATSVRINWAREVERQHGSHHANLLAHPALKALADDTRGAPLFRVATFANANASFGGQHAGFAWPHGLETADLYLNVYPLRYHQFWSGVIAPALERRADIRAYFNAWGNMAYLFNPDAELFETFVPPPERSAGLPFNLDLLSLANVRFVISRVTLTDPRLRLLEDARATPAKLARVLVYENPGVRPRFFVESAEGGDEPVKVLEYTADRIALEAHATRAGFLVASQSYSPYWHVDVNGQPARVIPAHHAFMGFDVPEGVSRVTLTYRPPASAGGRWQPLGQAALLLVIASVLLRADRRMRVMRDSRRSFPPERLDTVRALEDNHFWFEGRRQLVLRLLEPVVPVTAGLLADVGCGTGNFARTLAARGYRVLGLDPLGGFGARRDNNPRLIRGDACDLPLAHASCDAVVMLDVLEHTIDHLALSEARRVLKPGGALLVTVPAVPWLWSVHDERAGHLRRYSRADLRRRVEEAGFEIMGCHYYQCLLFPLLMWSRLRARTVESLEGERRNHPVLGLVTRLELFLGRWLRWPIGSTLVLVSRAR